MNPDIALDVSKGESQIQAFLDKGKPYQKSCTKRDLKGLGNLLEFLQEVEKSANGSQSTVVLESTDHYHYRVIQFWGSQTSEAVLNTREIE